METAKRLGVKVHLGCLGSLECDAFQAAAIVECPGADAVDSLSDGQALEMAAAAKRPHRDGVDAVRNGEVSTFAGVTLQYLGFVLVEQHAVYLGIRFVALVDSLHRQNAFFPMAVTGFP